MSAIPNLTPILGRATEAIIPPSIRDARSLAFGATMRQALSEPDFKRTLVERIQSVDAGLLPFLVREFSLQEIIEPDMDEAIIRGLLERAYELHYWKGYLYGIRLGLSLLNIDLEWVQWFNKTPQGQAGTHSGIIFADQPIYQNQIAPMSARQQRAALRMVGTMKRWSQDTEISIGLKMEETFGLAASVSNFVVCQADFSTSFFDLNAGQNATGAVSGFVVLMAAVTLH